MHIISLPTGRRARTSPSDGIESIRFGVGRIRTAFPDWHERVVDVFGSGDKVANRYVSTGTHKGTFWGIEPTGRRIEIQEISIFRIADNRIVEQWCMFDDLARLQQRGGRARIFAQGTEGLKSHAIAWIQGQSRECDQCSSANAGAQ
jgi:predicted ester cyclase